MVLRSELNWTSEEVNEQPLSKALADWCNWAHANDHIELVTEEDAAMAKYNDERIRLAFEAVKKKGANGS
jgi:accessory colonization factor AcfC